MIDSALHIALIVVAVLGAFVAITVPHEGGHFLLARLLRIPVDDVGLGLGPALSFRHRRWKRSYSIGLVPLGAYVEIPDIERRPLWQQVLVYLAGPAANLVMVSLIVGATALLLSHASLSRALYVALVVNPLLLGALFDLFTHGDLASSVGGPIAVVSITADAVSQGLKIYLVLVAALEFSIAIFNLLPIPPLDGGRVIVAAVRSAIGVERSEKWAMGVTIGGWVLMAGLIILISAHDIWGLLGR